METVISEFGVTGLQKYGKNSIMHVGFDFLIATKIVTFLLV